MSEMPKTAKKTGRSRKLIVQVEVTAVVERGGQELVGMDAETVGDALTDDAGRRYILIAQAGGSGSRRQYCQQGRISGNGFIG